MTVSRLEAALGDGVLCGLSKVSMRDPVIVQRTNDPALKVGMSYERSVLEAHLKRPTIMAMETRYTTNASLLRLIESFRQ